MNIINNKSGHNNHDGWDVKPSGWETARKKANKKEKFINYDEISNKYINIELDAIFVLAGGLDNKGLCHEFVEERLNLAMEIYNKKNRNIKIICLGGGTYHKPPILNQREFAIHESTACSEYLIANGVESKDIYKECSSYDTIANGWYAYLNYFIPMQLERVLIITSGFHMPRSKAIFEWILSFDNNDYKTHYEKTPNKGMSFDVLTARKKREANSLNNLKNNLILNIQTVKDFHKWFYEEHKAYCSNSELIREDKIDDEAKKSY